MPQTAAPHKEIVHKKTTKFTRIQADRFKRLKSAWRKPRGIDSRYRRKWATTPAHPHCGFGSDLETKFMLPNGFRPVIIRCLNDLEPLVTQNSTHCAVISHQCGGALRRQIEKRAVELDVFVANQGYRMKKEEQ